MSDIRQNLADIKRRLKGRPITVVGASKAQPLERIQEAIAAGLVDLGVNYVQEGLQLRKDAAGAVWHFIGHIQSRKVKNLVDYDWVQSLDRTEVIEALDSRLREAGRTVNGLIEVNIGNESSKSGIAVNEVPDFIRKLAGFPRIRARGLMVMVPALEPVEKRRAFFQRAKTIFDAHNAPGWDTLSMGTSDDFELAVDEGATMIRLGTVLFGPRA